jgi:hypothetical protein
LWINDYHRACRDKVLSFIDGVDYIDSPEEVKEWLIDATRTLEEYAQASSSTMLFPSATLSVVLVIQVISFIFKTAV